MADDTFNAGTDDVVGDLTDDIVYVHDADDADDSDDADRWGTPSEPSHVGWASVVTCAHHLVTWGRRRSGGSDGTGAG